MNYADDVKLPWKTVECAACKRCIAGRFFKRDPASDACKWCFLDRVRENTEAGRQKLAEIAKAVSNAEISDVKLMLADDGVNYTDNVLALAKNVDGALAKIRSILAGRGGKRKEAKDAKAKA